MSRKTTTAAAPAATAQIDAPIDSAPLISDEMKLKALQLKIAAKKALTSDTAKTVGKGAAFGTGAGVAILAINKLFNW